MDYKFSDNADVLKPSAIREILKLSSAPGIIPFSAGNPAPEAFPTDIIGGIAAELFKNDPIGMLQYSVTEGYTPLRNYIKDYMQQKYNTGNSDDEVLITCGAQQVMSLAALSFCQKGDAIICEKPSFVGSINALKLSGAELVGVELEDDGMNIAMLQKELSTRNNVKLIYIIPNFQNPAGVTMSLEKRKAVYELAKKYGVLILEDNPYGDLRVSGENVPAIKSLDEDGIVVYAGSFSKIVAPGIRVGYALAPKEIIAKLTVAKQTQDVHTPLISQLVVYKWLTEYDFESHINKIREIYRRKLNLLCDCVDKELSDFLTYHRPEGGLFVWAKLNDGIDMLDFCRKASAAGVSVVPGNAFMVDGDKECSYIRMNFSTPSDEAIVKGVKILGEVARSL